MLLSASVERFSISRMRDFSYNFYLDLATFSCSTCNHRPAAVLRAAAGVGNYVFTGPQSSYCRPGLALGQYRRLGVALGHGNMLIFNMSNILPATVYWTDFGQGNQLYKGLYLIMESWLCPSSEVCIPHPYIKSNRHSIRVHYSPPWWTQVTIQNHSLGPDYLGLCNQYCKGTPAQTEEINGSLEITSRSGRIRISWELFLALLQCLDG